MSTETQSPKSFATAAKEGMNKVAPPAPVPLKAPVQRREQKKTDKKTPANAANKTEQKQTQRRQSNQTQSSSGGAGAVTANAEQRKQWFNQNELVPKGAVAKRRSDDPLGKERYEARRDAVKEFAQFFLLERKGLDGEINASMYEIGSNDRPKPGLYFKSYRTREQGATVTVTKGANTFEFPVLDVYEDGNVTQRGLFGSRDFWSIVNDWYKPVGLHASLHAAKVPRRLQVDDDLNNPLNWQITGFVTFDTRSKQGNEVEADE